MTQPAVRALLTGIVDYAGLFPPAALSMQAAVAEYARALRSDEAFMLGRFVSPASRLEELGRAASGLLPAAGTAHAFRVSALLGADPAADARLIQAWNAAHAGRAVVDSVELKAASREQSEAALAALPPGLLAFVELLPDEELDDRLATLARAGARAKLRTGGVVREAIPEPSAVARFIAACAAAAVPFKATAGLHHPLRAEQALSYEPGSPRALMHGFVNVFVAAALARTGAGVAELEGVLREEQAAAFRIDAEGLAWRTRRVGTDQLAATRRDFAASFGSCSFAEPVADLRALGWLPPASQAPGAQALGSGGPR